MTDIFNKTGSKIKTESSTSRPGSHYKMGSQRGTPQPAEETEEPPIREPTPVPRCSIYMQTIEWLIEVKAVPVSLPNMELFFYYLSLNLPHYFFFFGKFKYFLTIRYFSDKMKLQNITDTFKLLSFIS